MKVRYIAFFLTFFLFALQTATQSLNTIKAQAEQKVISLADQMR